MVKTNIIQIAPKIAPSMGCIAFNAFSISVLPLNFFYIIFNLPNCGNTEPSPNCSKPDFE